VFEDLDIIVSGHNGRSGDRSLDVCKLWRRCHSPLSRIVKIFELVFLLEVTPPYQCLCSACFLPPPFLIFSVKRDGKG
jgi:hypothetical protein